jgi:hypothetical protein
MRRALQLQAQDFFRARFSGMTAFGIVYCACVTRLPLEIVCARNGLVGFV